jgi:hypothetical protein
MTRRQFMVPAILGSSAILLSGLGFRRRKEPVLATRSPFDRVVFVCCNDHSHYSPGIYIHGPDGGGPACLELANPAAPYMRAGDVSDSAGGLCGFLFTKFGGSGTLAGGFSLWDSPKPGADGAVDWQAYCAWNVDLILINVDRRTAECYVSPLDPKSPSKSLVSRLDGLKFGG